MICGSHLILGANPTCSGVWCLSPADGFHVQYFAEACIEMNLGNEPLCVTVWFGSQGNADLTEWIVLGHQKIEHLSLDREAAGLAQEVKS